MGTFLNGQKLDPLTKYELHDNDEIAIAPPERGELFLNSVLLDLLMCHLLDMNMEEPSLIL